jgi:Ca-activated chloride channel family protein
MKYSIFPYQTVRSIVLLAFVGTICFQIYGHEAAAETETPAQSALSSERTKGNMVLRSRVNMVLVPVSVTDKQERTVLSLSKDNFQVFEDNRRQAVQNVSLEDEPSSLGIVVDTSGSMKSKLSRTSLAVHELIGNANPNDELFLITFADRPRTPRNFTASPEGLEDALLVTAVGGVTALLDAVSLAVERMQDAKYPRRAIVIISDGGDNHSRETVSRLVNLVQESEILIYSIGLYDDSFQSIEEKQGPKLLEKLGEKSGGAAFVARDEGEITRAVRNIVHQVGTRYVLSYYPDHRSLGGQWHTIKVKLKLSHHSHLHVHAKAGYYALGK